MVSFTAETLQTTNHLKENYVKYRHESQKGCLCENMQQSTLMEYKQILAIIYSNTTQAESEMLSVQPQHALQPQKWMDVLCLL